MLHRCLPRPVTSARCCSSARRLADLGRAPWRGTLALGRAGATPGGRSRRSASGAATAKREVLELLLHLLHAEAVGQRGVDVERLLGDALAASRAGIAAIVRMLCSRSASLMIRTRRSLAIATSILRMVAACCASFESNWIRSSLVTPSTIAATSAPKLASTSASVISVSSTASCSSAAATVMSSSPRSATIRATASGWLM